MSAAVAPPPVVPAPSVSTTTAPVSNDENGVSSSNGPHYVPIRDAAAQLHSSLKDSNYSIVRLGVGIAESLSNTAYSFVPETVVNKVNEYGSPLIDAADVRLEHAYNKLQPVAASLANKINGVTGRFHTNIDAAIPAASQYLMNSEWFNKVDQIIKRQDIAKRINTRLHLSSNDLYPLLQTYYMTAAYQFLALAHRKVMDENAFITVLSEGLQNIWNIQLRAPSLKFHEIALQIWSAAGIDYQRDLTPYVLLERVKPLLGAEWEESILLAFKGHIEEPSQLIYVSALQQYQALKNQAISTGENIIELQQQFLSRMQQKLGAAYTHELQEPLTELITTWTNQVKTKNTSIQNKVYDRYQYLLLSAQQIFDRVLPPVIDNNNITPHNEKDESKEEQKQPVAATVEEEEYIAEPPRSLYDLASHVKDRVGERGVVNNVTTVSTNSVKEGVHLAANVAHQGVKVASNVASSALSTAHNVVRPVVDPVITRVSPIVTPIVQPYVDSARAQAKPVVDAVQLRQAQLVDAVQQRQAQLQQQVQTAYNSAKLKIEQIQVFIKQLSNDVVTNTKDTIRNTATSAANTISANIPSTIQARINELQQKLQAAAQYAQQLKQEGQQYVLQQQITQLSLSYAEVAKAIVQQQLHALQNNLNAEKLAALAEEAKVSVSQLILYTRKQLALEKGEDEADVKEEEPNKSTTTTTTTSTTTSANTTAIAPLNEEKTATAPTITTHITTPSAGSSSNVVNVTPVGEPDAHIIAKKVVVTTTTVPPTQPSQSSHHSGNKRHYQHQPRRQQGADQPSV